MRPGNRRFLFEWFAFFDRLTHAAIDLFPPPLRRIYYRIALHRFGSGSAIDYGTYIRYPWRVSIGNRVEINRGVEIIPSRLIPDARIIIEDDVIIAPGVVMFGAGQSRDPDRSDVGGTIRIRHRAYIGGRAVIRFGVTIGCGAVVGAGAVVTKDVPANAVVVGVPARVVISPRERAE